MRKPPLSDEQRDALQKHPGLVEVEDAETQKLYVLIAAEQFEQLKPLFATDPPSEQEQRALLQQAGERAGWDDSEMDAYDRYDDHRPADA